LDIPRVGSFPLLTGGLPLAIVRGVRNKLYTIPTCPHSSEARAFLDAKGVDYIEFDVSTDLDALRRMLSMTGRTDVPTIIAGYDAVVGFDPETWNTLLERSAETQRCDPLALHPKLGPDPYDGVD
jgi:glutaredoxin